MELSGDPTTEPFDDLDRLSAPELSAWWGDRVGEVLRVAAAELPFYQDLFDAAGFDPASFSGLDDLRRVPRCAKHDVLAAERRTGRARAGVERLEPGSSIVTVSSGTEGTMYMTWPPRWREVQGASSLRGHWWMGLRRGMPFLMVAPGWHVYAAVQSYVVEQLDLPAVLIAGTYLPRFANRIVDALRHFRPRFLILFLPMVFSLLAEARKQGLAELDVFASVERLVITGAPITPGMRRHLEERTGVPRIVELAGSSENMLAVECSRRAGLHVVPDTCFVEVLDEATGEPVGPGERGLLVHTTAVPWGSVYIRYHGGDVATHDSAPCPCGLPSPRIELLGRREHAFSLAGRRLLPYDVQLGVEEAVPELAGCAIAVVREGLAMGRLRLLCQPPDDRTPDGVEQRLVRSLGAHFEVAVEVRWARDLPLLFKGVPPLLSERDLG